MTGNPIFDAQHHPAFYMAVNSLTYKDERDKVWLLNGRDRPMLLDGYKPVPEAYAELNRRIDLLRRGQWEVVNPAMEDKR